jgi:flagellar biogenesis protein FliO
MASLTQIGGPMTGVWSTKTTMAAVIIGAVLAGLLFPQLLPAELAVDKTRENEKGKAQADYSAPRLPNMPNPQAMLTRLAAGTVIVLGLSVASIWCMRRWMQPQQAVSPEQRTMRLIESLPLGQRCSLQLVHLGQREILIGMDASGIKTIVPLPRPFEDVLGETEQPEPQLSRVS